VNNVLVDDTTTTIPLPTVETDAAPRWRLITRIAFRLCFIYFGLYILLTQMLQAMAPLLSFPSLQTTAVISKPVFWVIRHVFHIQRELAIMGGSGDKMFDWVLALCMLSSAIVMSTVWSIIDRKRLNYVRLQKWFRLYVRFGLATTFLGYGMVKASASPSRRRAHDRRL